MSQARAWMLPEGLPNLRKGPTGALDEFGQKSFWANTRSAGAVSPRRCTHIQPIVQHRWTGKCNSIQGPQSCWDCEPSSSETKMVWRLSLFPAVINRSFARVDFSFLVNNFLTVLRFIFTVVGIMSASTGYQTTVQDPENAAGPALSKMVCVDVTNPELLRERAIWFPAVYPSI